MKDYILSFYIKFVEWVLNQRFVILRLDILNELDPSRISVDQAAKLIGLPKSFIKIALDLEVRRGERFSKNPDGTYRL